MAFNILCVLNTHYISILSLKVAHKQVTLEPPVGNRPQTCILTRLVFSELNLFVAWITIQTHCTLIHAFDLPALLSVNPGISL